MSFHCCINYLTLLFCFGIKEPRDYFESQQGNVLNAPRVAGASKRNVDDAYQSLKTSLVEMRIKGLSDPLIKPEVSFKVLLYSNMCANQKNLQGLFASCLS